MELNGLRVAICLMYSSGVMESSDNVKKRWEKANHLHFVPLWIKQDTMNPFHYQHECRLKAYCLMCVFLFP